MKQEEVKVEPPKQEYEIRKKNKKSTSHLKSDIQSFALPQQVRDDFFNKEKQWFTEDNNILDFKATKNELESFTYDVKNNIDSYGPMEKYIEESQRVALMQHLQQTIDWIYGRVNRLLLANTRKSLTSSRRPSSLSKLDLTSALTSLSTLNSSKHSHRK